MLLYMNFIINVSGILVNDACLYSTYMLMTYLPSMEMLSINVHPVCIPSYNVTPIVHHAFKTHLIWAALPTGRVFNQDNTSTWILVLCVDLILPPRMKRGH